MTHPDRILTLNAGSSSLKAAIYAVDSVALLIAAADVDRIGLSGTRIRARDHAGHPVWERPLDAPDHGAALGAVLEWLGRDASLEGVSAVAHRVVHGGHFSDPQLVTPDVLSELRRFVAVDPDHQPQTLDAIDAIARLHPTLPQVACFDTAFHHAMPAVAQRYPLPERFLQAGVRRFGFHGLSCEYILTMLRELDPAAASGRLIVAHLGNGASMTAIHSGTSLDTTMGFSPAGGLMMGTRTGDLDPGVLLHALREGSLAGGDLNRLVNHDSGLLGVSGTSSDMRDLLSREAVDPRSAAAIALFCYTARKSLGALTAVLGGLDTLVFTGGIGERGGTIRERITSGLERFGLVLDPARNGADAPVISADQSRVTVRVINTNEDVVLARHARRVLRSGRERRSP